MSGRVAICVLIAAVLACSAHGAPQGPLAIPNVRDALIREGYPARTRCGVHPEPPPALQAHVVFTASTRWVRACGVVIERDGYSVHVSPHTSAAAAQVARRRAHNPWAKSKRTAAIGTVVVSAFRLPDREWDRITRTIETSLRKKR